MPDANPTSVLQARRPPKVYRVWDQELEVFAEADPWVSGESFAAVVVGVGLTLIAEAVVADGTALSAFAGGIIGVVGLVAWQWTKRPHPLKRALLVAKIRSESSDPEPTSKWIHLSPEERQVVAD